MCDELIVEGNDEFKSLLLKKTSTRTELQRAQSKIEIGLKRKKELEEQKSVLGMRKKELDDLSSVSKCRKF